MNGYRIRSAPTVRECVCWRCGRDMPNPLDRHLTADSPCLDCREVLELEGVPLDRWTTRPKKTRTAA